MESKRPSGRQKRPVSDLPLEPRTPSSRNIRVAIGTRAARRDPILLHEIPEPLDKERLAGVAARVLQIADLPGKVPGVDVLQPVRTRDRGCAQEHFWRRVGG